MVLTLLGGGAFGNEKRWIFESIYKVHQLYSRHPKSQIEKVTLSLFSDSDLWPNCFNKMEELDMPFEFHVYEKGQPKIRRKYPK